jgi:hypothetical protein
LLSRDPGSSAGKRRKKREKIVLFPGKWSVTRKLEITRVIVCYLEIPALRPGREGRSAKREFFFRASGARPGNSSSQGSLSAISRSRLFGREEEEEARKESSFSGQVERDPETRDHKGHCLLSQDPGSSAGKRRKKREKRALFPGKRSTTRKLELRGGLTISPSPDLIRGLELIMAIACHLEIPALRPGKGSRWWKRFNHTLL